MELDPKLIMSASAIVLSSASFILAIRNSLFTKRVKGIELRAQLLIKLAEIRILINESRLFCRLKKNDAERTSDIQLYEMVNRDEFFDRASKKVDLLYEKISAIDASRGADAYATGFHELHDIFKMLEYNKASLESYLKDRPTKPLPNG